MVIRLKVSLGNYFHFIAICLRILSIDTLPEIMQFFAKILPTAHIFESMRSIIINKEMISKSLGLILFLNLFFFNINYFLLKMIEVSRRKRDINESGRIINKPYILF